MAAIKTAKFTTPDGVERLLRFTQAAQFRVAMEQEKGPAPHYFILWAMMFDEDDNPPRFMDGHSRAGQPMSAGWLGANLSPLDATRVLSAISEATTGAVVEKKIIEVLEKQTIQQTERLAGLIRGLSQGSTSESAEPLPVQNGSSGSSGGSPQESSTASVGATLSESETPMSVPA